ncbi:phage protein Gp27 family protein, partial [Escherichia coli]
GLNRYASRMEKVGAKIRASREMAEVWAAKLGSAPTSDVGKLLMEFVKTLAFETSMSMAEDDKPVAPKAL